MIGPAKNPLPASALASLRERVRALERGGASSSVLPFGAPLDAALPQGGLALGALHEVIGAGPDEEDGAVAAAFAAGILGRLAKRRGAPVLWCQASGDLHAPGLLRYGLPPQLLLVTRGRNDSDILWAMEEGLRSAALAAVLGEIGTLPATAGRRLQLAAEAGGVTAFALRRWRDSATAERQSKAPSAAVTRWRIAAAPSRDEDEPGIGTPLWRVELLRCRGGNPGSWLIEEALEAESLMEENHATGHVAVAAELADRPAAAPLRRFG